jgi:hypothetical protein
MVMVRAGLLASLVGICFGGCWGFPVVHKEATEENLPEIMARKICSSVSGTSDSLGYQLGAPCCGEAVFASSEQCLDVVGARWVESRDAAAMTAGLVFSAVCVEALASARMDATTLDCPSLASGTFATCEDDCQIFHGDQPEGAACEAYGHRMSDCAQGLVCGADRVCHQPCEIPFIAPEGGFCGAARGMWFVQCDAGLSCNAEGLCEAAQPLGGPCSADVDCAIGGWCDASVGACASDNAGGTACERHEQCTSDVCKAGVCFEPESPECGRWAW